MRQQVLETIRETKVIAIVRGVEGNSCIRLAEAMYAGGIRLIEFTFDMKSPDSWNNNAAVIRDVGKAMQGKLFVGAGTVCSVDLCELAANANAQFIISPDTDEDVIRRTRELGLVSIPGALTPSEIKAAKCAGADIVKIFPASVMGTAYIKAVRAPLGHIPIMAVGGVNERNAGDFIRAGCCGVGVGGNLVNKEWIAAGDFEKITASAAEYLRAVDI